LLGSVIVKIKTSKEVVRIFRKVSTGRSLNSCVDFKTSISVTSEALEIFRVTFESALKIRLPTSLVI
jgi:hypothetical protein